MTYVGLFIFFLVFIIFCISFKSDLYIHQHDNAINDELDTFNTNFETLKALDGDTTCDYKISDAHLYQ